MEIRALDPTGNFATVTISITLEDTTNPTWDETPQDQTSEWGTSFSYNVNASDLDGIDSYWLSDAINFTVDGNGVITNNTITSPKF